MAAMDHWIKARELYADTEKQNKFVSAMEQLDRALERNRIAYNAVTPEERARRDSQPKEAYGRGAYRPFKRWPRMTDEEFDYWTTR
jgi:hypothetical protein